MKPFKTLIGQQAIKNRLTFALQAHEAGRMIPHFLFVGAFGNGKSQFLREFAKNIKSTNGKPRKLLELNCSSITTLTGFVEKVLQPHVVDRDICLALDECHCLPKEVMNWLLTVLNTEKSPIRKVMFGDAEIEFDFLRQSFFFATTEQHKLTKPLKSRMETLAMAPYSLEELQEIIQLNVPDVEFEDNVLEEVASAVKGTARSCVLMASKIEDFCLIKGRKCFGTADFRNLSHAADIKEHGLDSVEVSILKILNIRGAMSLNELSASLGLSRQALMNDHEHHLMKKGFLRIDGKRKITTIGQKVIEKFK